MNRKLFKLGVIMSLSVSCISPLQANSESGPSCEQVLDQCDEALRAADEALAAQDDQIDALLKSQEASQNRIEELERQNNSVFRSPLVIGLVGLVGGLVLGVVVAK